MSDGTIDIRVYDFMRRPLAGARVSAGRRTRRTDDNGYISLDISNADAVRVRKCGYEEQTRLLTGRDRERMQLFLLGRNGMPYYWRGLVKVPFEPILGVIGIATNPAVSVIRKRPTAKIIRDCGNFAQSGIVIEAFDDAGDPEALGRYLQKLSNDPSIKHAGSVLQLSDEHASFLTDLVIARFDRSVSESAVAHMAERHRLALDECLDPDQNVYALRYAGPATYEVLHAANGLAKEQNVVWAEPNIVSTIELDAVIPTDFLFDEQWDHQIIRTPEAWQALKDMNPADPDRSFGDPDIVIAVLDSGIDATHPELSGTVSNGYPKQVALYDFVYKINNMSNISLSLSDFDRDHGTCCASACVGNTNNASVVASVGEGIAGVAGNCRLIAARVSGSGDVEYANWYLWAAGFSPKGLGSPAKISPGADVITSSFGWADKIPMGAYLLGVLDKLTNEGRGGKGVLLFFSVGNDQNGGKDLDAMYFRPLSTYDRCFGIAASTMASDGATEIRASYSNYGSTVDWCVPSSTHYIGTVHNPPTSFGAHAATLQAAPYGDVICGHPAHQSTLASDADKVSVLNLTSATGFAPDQAARIKPLNGDPVSARQITSVDLAKNKITIDAPLNGIISIGADVAAGPPSYITNFGGTSYAAPVAAGVAALMLSANPDLYWYEVRDILNDTAVKIDPVTGQWYYVLGRKFSKFYGYGRINAAAAVAEAGWRIALTTPAIDFKDVPAGTTAVAEISFDVRSQWAVDFSITSGPDAPFKTSGNSVSLLKCSDATTARPACIKIEYTGTTAGDTASGSVTVWNAQTKRQWTIPLTANTISAATPGEISPGFPAAFGNFVRRLLRRSKAQPPDIVKLGS